MLPCRLLFHSFSIILTLPICIFHSLLLPFLPIPAPHWILGSIHDPKIRALGSTDPPCVFADRSHHRHGSAFVLRVLPSVPAVLGDRSSHPEPIVYLRPGFRHRGPPGLSFSAILATFRRAGTSSCCRRRHFIFLLVSPFLLRPLIDPSVSRSVASSPTSSQ